MVRYLILLFSIALSLLFLFLLSTSKKYNQYTDSLKAEEYPLKCIYGVGFKLMELLKVNFKSQKYIKYRQDIVIIYGEKYADYYMRVLTAQKYAYTYLAALIVFLFSCMASASDSIIFLGIGLLIVFLIYYRTNNSCRQKIRENSVRYMSEFPSIVSSLALLVNAGMILREAWMEVANSSDGEINKQMLRAVEDMNNGKSDAEAIYAFSNRCATQQIRKFTSILLQAMDKGGKDLTYSLKEQSEVLWESKKQLALQKGALAADKLLVPIMIMFIGVLILVMGPIMSNIGI